MKLNEFIIVTLENNRNDHYETNVYIGSGAIHEICDYILAVLSEEVGKTEDKIVSTGEFETKIENAMEIEDIREFMIHVGELRFGSVVVYFDVNGEGYNYQLRKDLEVENGKD